MEPLEEMLESARVMDEAGMDTIWLADAYPWWRKHGMEARSSTVVSALMARETERLTIGFARQHAQLKTLRSTSARLMRSESPHITIDQDRLVDGASQAMESVPSWI
jgi:hypothetical protein